MTVEPYSGRHKHYYCGKELLTLTTDKSKKYTLLVVDLEQAYCAEIYSDGEIRKKFDLTSGIPKKHKKGGQSAKRYAQNRENMITKWFKDINDKLMELDSPVYLSINFVYKNRLFTHLHSYALNKITRVDKNEYGGLTGIYQYLNLLEREGL